MKHPTTRNMRRSLLHITGLFAAKNHTLFKHDLVLLVRDFIVYSMKHYNQKGGKTFQAGDVVPYVICEDGTTNSATQRAYHVEELKNSPTLKIDIKYYLAQQIHPVVSRLCEPIEGIDAYEIGHILGLEVVAFKKPMQSHALGVGDNLKTNQQRFENVAPFMFVCAACKTENRIRETVIAERTTFLEKCANEACAVRPVEYLPAVQNQLVLRMRDFIKQYYSNVMTCEDPACTNETSRMPLRFAGKYPVCTLCKNGVMYKKYSEGDLYSQLSFFRHLFDLSKLEKRFVLEASVEAAFHTLKDTADKLLKHSGYAMVNLEELFSGFLLRHQNPMVEMEENLEDELVYNREDD